MPFQKGNQINKGAIRKRGAESHSWKGEKTCYIAKHIWVYTQLGQPTKCSHCEKDGLTGHQIHWANVSGKYLRDLNDWIRLCAKCHHAFDKDRHNHIPWNKGKKAPKISAGLMGHVRSEASKLKQSLTKLRINQEKRLMSNMEARNEY